MVVAKAAREWAHDNLRGLGDSLYTPFAGPDGDDIDCDALRALVRYCLSDLDHEGLWLVGGMAEFGALTNQERKTVVEIATREARQVKPDAFVGVSTVALSAKETVELTQHAASAGADLAYIQNPMMEVQGGPGVLEFFRYVAARTDIALGIFNSPSSGYVMTPAEVARIIEEIPAVCTVKEASPDAGRGIAISKMVPGKVVMWDVSGVASAPLYNGGYVRSGLQGPCELGAIAYLKETPADRRYSTWFKLVLAGQLEDAVDYYFAHGVDQLGAFGYTYTRLPERPDYWTHFGSGNKYAAQLLGLPVGDYPHSRPPQLKLTDGQKTHIEASYARTGLINQ